MRYASGRIGYQVPGIATSGLGSAWGHTLSYSNRPDGLSTGFNGEHWAVNELPRLVEKHDGESLALVRGSSTVLWFDRSHGEYHPRYYDHDRLEHDSEAREFVHIAEDGRRTRFYDFSVVPLRRGLLKGFSDPAGHEGVVGYDREDRLVFVNLTGEGEPSGERYEYVYENGGANEGRLKSVTCEAGGELMRRSFFEYYEGSVGAPRPGSEAGAAEPAKGEVGDLKRVTLQARKNGHWVTMDQYYFRYYTSWNPPGVPHGIKFVVEPEAYKRMVSDSIDPEEAPDWQLAQYADYYFEFDDFGRAVVEEVMGGSHRYTFERTRSEFHPASGDYNQWVMKTVETLPEGHRNIVFTNRAGQMMLKVFKSEDATKQWCLYRRYDGKARTVLEAESSAFRQVGGRFYDENEADLVGFDATNGTARFLRDIQKVSRLDSGNETIQINRRTTDRKDTDEQDNLVVRTETLYDSRGRVYLRSHYTLEDDVLVKALEERIWFDAEGSEIKRVREGRWEYEETRHDGLGRVVKNYVCLNPSKLDDKAIFSDCGFDQNETTEMTCPGGSGPHNYFGVETGADKNLDRSLRMRRDETALADNRYPGKERGVIADSSSEPEIEHTRVSSGQSGEAGGPYVGLDRYSRMGIIVFTSCGQLE